ncbi:MAG: TlpA family protein disulfide reductase, partial [Candidatus Aminicenantia bacterium]
LNFFATWCRFCRMEIPELVSLASEYKDKVHIFSISVDENPQQVLPKFINDYKINYPVLLFNESVVSAYGGLTEGIPYTVLIDKNGIIRKTYLGARDKKVFTADIEKLLK